MSHIEYPQPLTDDELDNLRGNAQWALASNVKTCMCASPPSIPRRCPKFALALTRTSAQPRPAPATRRREYPTVKALKDPHFYIRKYVSKGEFNIQATAARL